MNTSPLLRLRFAHLRFHFLLYFFLFQKLDKYKTECILIHVLLALYHSRCKVLQPNMFDYPLSDRRIQKSSYFQPRAVSKNVDKSKILC